MSNAPKGKDESLGSPSPTEVLSTHTLPPKTGRYRRRGEVGQHKTSLTEDQEKFLSFRIRGFTPLESVKFMDTERGRPSTPHSQEVRGARFEDTVKHFLNVFVTYEDMSDVEFERYYDACLSRIALHPRESSTVALSALREMRKRREERRFQDPAAMIEGLHAAQAELRRLADIKNWGIKGARRDAGQKKGDKAHQLGERSEKSLEPATLDALTKFRDELKEELGIFSSVVDAIRKESVPC